MEQTLFFGIALGAVIGAFGQGLRVVAGLKKQWDEADYNGITLKANFDPTRFWLSLFIGAIAGVGAYLALRFGAGPAELLDVEGVFAIAAAGYAGADFVEAFLQRHLPR